MVPAVNCPCQLTPTFARPGEPSTNNIESTVFSFLLQEWHWGFKSPSNPKPQTLNSKPQTLNPKPQTLNPKPQTLNPKPQTLNSKPQTLNPKPQTLNPKPQTLNPKPQTLNPKTSTLNAKEPFTPLHRNPHTTYPDTLGPDLKTLQLPYLL